MYISQVSGERLQDHWSSGLINMLTALKGSQFYFLFSVERRNTQKQINVTFSMRHENTHFVNSKQIMFHVQYIAM